MKILIGVLITLCLLVCVHQAHADTTTINQKGMPVPSAMAPSMSAFSQDVCAVPISAAGNLGFISLSGGTVLLDENCVKIKLAKTLNDLGLKVAAVSVLCQDPKVWDAMEMSGSPCPMGGAVGYTAKKAWYEKDPEKFLDVMGDDKFKDKVWIIKTIRAGIIRKGVIGTGFNMPLYFGDIYLGKGLDEAINFLLDKENQNVFIGLKKAYEAYKKEKS